MRVKAETERIERLLRNAPRPVVPGDLPEKLKSEIRLFPQNARSLAPHSLRIEIDRSLGLSTLWRFLKSNRLHLTGLGVAWIIILLCPITLPTSDGTTTMAQLNRPSPEMFKALAEENQRLLFATFRWVKPEVPDAKPAPPRNEVQKKSDAG